jgi:hypothetical protein
MNLTRTAESVKTVFLEAFSFGYLLVDGIRGYVLRNVAVERGVKVRDRSGVLQIGHARFHDRESRAVVTRFAKSGC